MSRVFFSLRFPRVRNEEQGETRGRVRMRNENFKIELEIQNKM